MVLLVHTTSELRALTEATARDDTPSTPPALDHGPETKLEEDTLQLQPVALRRVAPKPVFVDASGRNRRRLRLLVAGLVTPIVAYVALLISTLVGGPTIPSALLPHPAITAQPHTAQVHAKSRPHKSHPSSRGVKAAPAPTGVRTTARPSSLSPAPTASKTARKGKPKPTASLSPSRSPKPTPTLPRLLAAGAG